MKIIAEYDSSAANAPAGFKQAVQAAINYYDQVILNPVTVTIMFSYGELEGSSLSRDALAESDTNGYIEPFSQVTSWLTAAATSQADDESISSLPLTDPTGGAMFWVADAQARIFGAGSNPNFTDPEDGFAALSSRAPFTFDPTNRAVKGDYDAVGAMEHEITEAIGRISYLGQGSFDGDTLYSPLDLFRFSGPGVHDIKPESGYFSVNGQTMLLPYNDPTNGGDGGDWAASVFGDSYGDGSEGTAGIVTPTDLLEMDLLGFTISMPTTDDFNDDQKSDVLIENGAGAVVVGEVGTNNQLSYAQVSALGHEWSFFGAGDFVGDGNADFLIQNTAGAVVIGEVVKSQTTYTQVGALGPEWKFVGVGDFLGHGLTDFLIENTSGAVVAGELGANDQAAYTQVGALGSEWKFVGAGDFNGDGQSDFLIENTAGAVVVGEVGANGQAAYNQVTALGPEWKFVGTGDFLGDGTSDFLIENTSGAVVLGHIIDGAASFTQVGALGSEWKFVGTGDFLGEGHMQFLIENTGGAVVVGDIENGTAHYTQVGALGSDWVFHL